MDRETILGEHFEAQSRRIGLPAEYLRFEASLAFKRQRLASIVEALMALGPVSERGILDRPGEKRLRFRSVGARIDSRGRLRRGPGILGKKSELAFLLSYHGFEPEEAPRIRAISLGGLAIVEDRGGLALLAGLLRSRGETCLGLVSPSVRT